MLLKGLGYRLQANAKVRRASSIPLGGRQPDEAVSRERVGKRLRQRRG